MGRIFNPISAIVGFVVHAVVFSVAAFFFYRLNMETGDQNWWYWPVLGWGLGLVFHLLGTVVAVLKAVTGGAIFLGPGRAILDLFWHVASYVLVIGFLFLVNRLTGEPTWWYWPALGWGIGLVAHVFGSVAKLGLLLTR